MRILFTDTIGAAVLHNRKPAPANRAANWKTNPLPYGDKANRQSDHALTRIRYGDDFGATFDVTQIPVASQRLNLVEVNGDVIGTVGATPTGMAVTAPSTAVVALARSGTAPGDYGYNGLIAKHLRDSTAADTIVGYLAPAATVGHHATGTIALYIPSGSTAASITVGLENGATGPNVSANADLTKTNQWQVVTVSGVVANSPQTLTLRMTGPTGALVYSDLWTLVDTDDSTVVRMVDIADRLVYHLENGGTCEVDTGDYDGNIYATCGLYPGATATPPVLADKKLLEYTLSLNLVNLAGSPARMRCHYVA